jgi:hypothetical protein
MYFLRNFAKQYSTRAQCKIGGVKHTHLIQTICLVRLIQFHKYQNLILFDYADYIFIILIKKDGSIW